MHTILLDKSGYVTQKWNGTHISALDPRAYPGKLLQVEGNVACGMRYIDGAFYMVPAKVEAADILTETERRLEVFPAALQAQIVSQVPTLGIAMLQYIQGVHAKSREFLAADSAPADFQDDKHWPVLPDLASSPVPIVPPQPMTVHQAQTTQVVEVRVIHETQAVPARVIEHVPAVMTPESASAAVARPRPSVVPAERVEPLRPVETAEDIEAARRAFVAASKRVFERNKDGMPQQDLAFVVNLAAVVTGATSVAQIRNAEAELKDHFRGIAA